jgi:hypothetical protein
MDHTTEEDCGGPRVMKEISRDIKLEESDKEENTKKSSPKTGMIRTQSMKSWKICRNRLRKGTKKTDNDQNNWITFFIILESNPLVTKPEDVTQSSNLDVAMNSNVAERI